MGRRTRRDLGALRIRATMSQGWLTEERAHGEHLFLGQAAPRLTVVPSLAVRRNSCLYWKQWSCELQGEGEGSWSSRIGKHS